MNEPGDYLSKIASGLLVRFAFDSFDGRTLERVDDALHNQLKALPLRLGHSTEGEEFRSMTVFIYGHESRILERLKGLLSTVGSRRAQSNMTHFTQDWLDGDTKHDAATGLVPHTEASVIPQDSFYELPQLQPDNDFAEHRNDD